MALREISIINVQDEMRRSDEHTLNMQESYVYLVFYCSIVNVMLHWRRRYFYTNIFLAYGSPLMPNLEIDGWERDSLNLF
jgi:hypothetical protein